MEAWLSGSVLVSIHEVILCRAWLVLGWAMGNHPQANKPPRFVIIHSGQLSLLPSARRKMNTSQSAVMLCSWGVKEATIHSTC